MTDTAIFLVGVGVSALVVAFLVLVFAAMRADPHEDASD